MWPGVAQRRLTGPAFVSLAGGGNVSSTHKHLPKHIGLRRSLRSEVPPIFCKRACCAALAARAQKIGTPNARRCGGEHGSPSLTTRLPTNGFSAVPDVALELPGSPRCSEERRAKAWCDYEAGYRARDALKAFLSRGPVMI